ncbi:MAG: glycosyltransferase family 4 protein [Pseudomonadales bacterium]|nr:glycosyltransferase family 4 protein [Pseudomonadales bacterium]
MKILVYSDYQKLNHSVRPELEIFLRLAKRGHQLTVCSPAFDDRDIFQQAGIETVATGQKKKISPHAIRVLRQQLKAHHHEIVYATSSRTIPTAAFACIGQPAKLVCYRGTTRGLKRRDPTSFLTVLHPRVDAVVCVSGSVEQAVQKKLLNKRCQTTTIFKGHDLSWYTQTPADLSEFGIPGDAFVAIAAARFRPSKGLDVLLEATQKLADLDKLHLLVVGSGADEPRYSQLCASSPMQQRIHCTGYRPDAPSLIAASDILVQASVDGEGLPRSILEGLAYGVPAISTTAGGAREILQEGRTGFIVPIRNPQAIADKLRAVYQQREQLAAMSNYCKQAIEGPLSCDASVLAYEKFFEQLAAQ